MSQHPSRKLTVKLEQRLADAHISAIWFPEGEYQYIEQILELLMV